MSTDMKRREFISLLGGAAAAFASPPAARAQQDRRVRRIGVLMGLVENDPDAQPRIAAFRKRLQELGWTEGRNIQFDYRWMTPGGERLRADAAELVKNAPDLIVADTTSALAALRPFSGDIPVVFLRVSDPVGGGFIDNLARPGGKITGIANFEYAMGGKWLELLKQIAPRLSRMTVLSYPGSSAHAGLWQVIESAAPSFKLEAKNAPVRDTAEIERAILAAAGEPDSGLLLLPFVTIEINRAAIIDLAARHRLPAIYPLHHFATAGGLIAYGVEALDLYRQTAVYVDRILKGTRPSDLPVQQPGKFELVINLKTAKMLGLEVSSMLLALADEVIE